MSTNNYLRQGTSEEIIQEQTTLDTPPIFPAEAGSRGPSPSLPFYKSLRRRIAMLGLLGVTTLAGTSCKGCDQQAHRANIEGQNETEQLEKFKKIMPKVTFLNQAPALVKPVGLEKLTAENFTKAAQKFCAKVEPLFQKTLAPLLKGENIVETPEQQKGIETFLTKALHIAKSIPEFQSYLAGLEEKDDFTNLSKKLKPLFLAGNYYFSAHPALAPDTSVDEQTHVLEFLFFKIEQSKIVQLEEKGKLIDNVPAFKLSRISSIGTTRMFGSQDSDLEAVFVVKEDIQDIVRKNLELPLYEKFRSLSDNSEELLHSIEQDRFTHMAAYNFMKKRFSTIDQPGFTLTLPLEMDIAIAPKVSKKIKADFKPENFYSWGALGVELYHSQAKIPMGLLKILQGQQNSYIHAFTREILPAFIVMVAPPSEQKEELVAAIRNEQTNPKRGISSLRFAQLYLDTFTPADKEKLALRIYDHAYDLLDHIEEMAKKNPPRNDDGQTPLNL